MALEIFSIRVKHDINVVPCWLPREENELADAISKYRDTDDWSIDNETFAHIQRSFGRLDVDHLAGAQGDQAS